MWLYPSPIPGVFHRGDDTNHEKWSESLTPFKPRSGQDPAALRMGAATRKGARPVCRQARGFDPQAYTGRQKYLSAHVLHDAQVVFPLSPRYGEGQPQEGKKISRYTPGLLRTTCPHPPAFHKCGDHAITVGRPPRSLGRVEAESYDKRDALSERGGQDRASKEGNGLSPTRDVHRCPASASRAQNLCRTCTAEKATKQGYRSRLRIGTGLRARFGRGIGSGDHRGGRDTGHPDG